MIDRVPMSPNNRVLRTRMTMESATGHFGDLLVCKIGMSGGHMYASKLNWYMTAKRRHL